MAEILRVISSSPTDALPVFQTIVRSAVALGRCLFANVFLFDGELLHYVASHSTGPDYEYLLRSKYPMRPDMSQVSGRVLLSKSVVRLEDVSTDPDYDRRFPEAMGWTWRMLGVPMLRDGRPLGAIVVGWAEAGPITNSQEELLKTFADQAVIALENVRLFDETQEKSRQLDLANTYKTRFLAAASHDLRQPLHALNLFVAQLQVEPDPAARSRLVAQIDAAVGAINELFNALLDMSKLEAGVLEPTWSIFPSRSFSDAWKRRSRSPRARKDFDCASCRAQPGSEAISYCSSGSCSIWFPMQCGTPNVAGLWSVAAVAAGGCASKYGTADRESRAISISTSSASSLGLPCRTVIGAAALAWGWRSSSGWAAFCSTPWS